MRTGALALLRLFGCSVKKGHVPALNTLILSKVLLELSFQPCGQMCMIGLYHA